MSLLSHVRYRTKASFISFSSFLLSFVSLSLIHLSTCSQKSFCFSYVIAYRSINGCGSCSVFCFNKSKDYLRSKQKAGMKIAKQINHPCYSKLNVTLCLIIAILVVTKKLNEQRRINILIFKNIDHHLYIYIIHIVLFGLPNC